MFHHWLGADHGRYSLDKIEQMHFREQQLFTIHAPHSRSYPEHIPGCHLSLYLHTLICFQGVQLLEMAIGLVSAARALFRHRCTSEIGLAFNLETGKLIPQGLVRDGAEGSISPISDHNPVKGCIKRSSTMGTMASLYLGNLS